MLVDPDYVIEHTLITSEADKSVIKVLIDEVEKCYLKEASGWDQEFLNDVYDNPAKHQELIEGNNEQVGLKYVIAKYVHGKYLQTNHFTSFQGARYVNSSMSHQPSIQNIDTAYSTGHKLLESIKKWKAEND